MEFGTMMREACRPDIRAGRRLALELDACHALGFEVYRRAHVTPDSDAWRIDTPGRLENEPARAVFLEALHNIGEGLAECTYSDSSESLQEYGGAVYLCQVDSQGFFYSRRVKPENVEREALEMNGRATLLGILEYPDLFDGACIGDPSELESIAPDIGEALFVNDHGNATLFIRHSGEWLDAASFV